MMVMPESDVEKDIMIDLLVYGDDKAENIGRRVDRPPSSVSRSLADMRKDSPSLLSAKGGGVYRLTEQGRRTAQALFQAGHNPYTERADGGADDVMRHDD